VAGARGALAAALALLLAACAAGDAPTAPAPTSATTSAPVRPTEPPPATPVVADVALLPSALVLTTGRQHALALVARDAAGRAVDAPAVAWASSDTAIARIDAAGRVTARRAGEASVTARVGGVSRTVPVRVEPEAAGAFAVTVRPVGDAALLLAGEARRAAARWERVVAGDLGDVELALPAGTCGWGTPALHETVDDVLLLLAVDTLDGPGGTLASTAVCVARQGSGLPAVGLVRIDAADLATLRAMGAVEQVIAHEVGHVLGIGTAWSGPRALLAGGAAPGYVGDFGRRAAATLGFTAEGAPVPVEGEGGAGTRGLHWRETTFGHELMTGWVTGGDAPLSAVTVGALRDLGYAVNEGSADPFSAPLAGVAPTSSSLGLALSTSSATPLAGLAMHESLAPARIVLGTR
jgi:hypothetical protein